MFLVLGLLTAHVLDVINYVLFSGLDHMWVAISLENTLINIALCNVVYPQGWSGELKA